MRTLRTLYVLFLLSFSISSVGQQPLTSDLLEESAIRFTLTDQFELTESAKDQWANLIGDSQFVGLAEVHNSAQLSLFTKAILPVLEEKGYAHFAFEMGPTSAQILQDATKNSAETTQNIRKLNREYGKKGANKTPLVFTNKIEDALFLQEASKLGFGFWGLDQEYAFSFEMLIDHLNTNYPQTSEEYKSSYRTAKSKIGAVIFKNKVEGQSVYCWYLESKEFSDYFKFFSNSPEAQKIVDDIKKSWKIYCQHTRGGSNQLRANYMKKNFANYLLQVGMQSKVLLKFGGIHLTHGISTFGVDDIGKYVTEIAQKNNTGFLTIRHLIAYRNGKSNIGKSGWKSIGMFLELGRKDQWTVVDLRPFRKMLKNKEIATNKKYAFELNSYDLLLLPPDDQYPKVNY
ncbi:MAG: hypothetical protein AAF391_00160 [Bacteroidota bacterium]